MKDYRKLDVWNLAHQITLKLYRITAKFPREELFGLTSQIRRCSASIGANIAEGCGRRGNGEFHRFLQMASGSASELDYHLLLAHDLSFITEEIYRPLNSELGSMRRKLTTLILKVDADRHVPDANGQMPTAARND
ncbi:MAG: four helix bundle protein [Acidobacteriia bacterium]|nr:four helix bundle protein [Terriglobia bacterium]